MVCLAPGVLAGIFVGRAVFKIRDLREINRLFPLTGLASLSMAVVISFFLILKK